MEQFHAMKKWFIEEESGQGMVEYGLIIVLIALGVITALSGVGNKLVEKFNQIVTQLDTH